MRKLLLVFAVFAIGLSVQSFKAFAQDTAVEDQQKQLADFLQTITGATMQPNEMMAKIGKKFSGAEGRSNSEFIDEILEDLSALKGEIGRQREALASLKVPEGNYFTALFPQGHFEKLKEHSSSYLDKFFAIADNMEKLLLSAQFGDVESTNAFAVLLLQNSAEIISSQRDFVNLRAQSVSENDPSYNSLKSLEFVYNAMESIFGYLSPLEPGFRDNNLAIAKLQQSAKDIREQAALGKEASAKSLRDFKQKYAGSAQVVQIEQITVLSNDWFDRSDAAADLIEMSIPDLQNPILSATAYQALLQELAEVEFHYAIIQKAKVAILQ